MPEIILILNDVRSTFNVGSLLRTSDGLGVTKVYLCGITPYPKLPVNERRLPHIAAKLDAQIHKTALGAENSVAWEYHNEVHSLISELKKQNWKVCALEQDPLSVTLARYKADTKTVLLVGAEVTGLPIDLLKECDEIIEIPMVGKKESFNVSVAAAIALFWITR